MKGREQLPIDLRGLYKPVQPAVGDGMAGVQYVEYEPAKGLQNTVYCYWQLKTTEGLGAPFYYRVVADGCIDIFFELGNFKECYVMGFCKQYVKFKLEAEFNYFGIRFLPTMLPQLFGLDAKTIVDREVPLIEVLPAVAHSIEEIQKQSKEVEEMIKGLDAYLLRQLDLCEFDCDKRLYAALEKILKTDGVLNVETDLDTGISKRQLRRLFEFYIGDTPKVFSKVVRFQNLLKGPTKQGGLKQNKFYYDKGYYDQSHFIKEFKAFYGLTPSKVLEK